MDLQKVRVYTLECCPNCERLKQYLHEHQIPFETADLDDPDTMVDLLYQVRAPLRDPYSTTDQTFRSGSRTT